MRDNINMVAAGFRPRNLNLRILKGAATSMYGSQFMVHSSLVGTPINLSVKKQISFAYCYYFSMF